MTFEVQQQDEDEKQRRELRFLGQDIKLFLRLASTHFKQRHDREVIAKLNALADQYACGIDILRKE